MRNIDWVISQDMNIKPRGVNITYCNSELCTAIPWKLSITPKLSHQIWIFPRQSGLGLVINIWCDIWLVFISYILLDVCLFVLCVKLAVKVLSTKLSDGQFYEILFYQINEELVCLLVQPDAFYWRKQKTRKVNLFITENCFTQEKLHCRAFPLCKFIFMMKKRIFWII